MSPGRERTAAELLDDRFGVGAMRLLRLGWRVQTRMIAVAVVALPLAGWRLLGARRAEFEAAAATHRDAIRGLTVGRGPASYGDGLWGYESGSVPPRRLTPRECRRDEWHFALMLKYTRGADRPWMPVAPDPPEPE